MNSKALENFLIPEVATEGFFNKFKSLKNNKNSEKIDPEKKKKFEIANNKYKFSTMNKDQYENFSNKIQKEAESYIKTAVNKANHDIEYLKKVRNDFAEYNSLINMETGDSEDIKTLKSIKPGYFKCHWDGEYWEIIEDQEVANCCDLHCNIVEALNNKYSELSSAKIIWFSYGDGDEGCIYIETCSFENMKKKCVSYEIATEGVISNFKAKREQKKAEREEKKMLARERDNECKNLLPKIMNDLKESVSKYKAKYPDLPIDPYYDTDKTMNEVFVCVFDDIEVMNEYSDNYNKKSIMVFNAIYNAVKNYCSTSEKKYPGFDLKCDIPENGYIHIRVY